MGQDCPSVLLYMMHSNNNNNIYLCNGQIQTLWFLNLLIRQVLKCITLLPANLAIPMVEVTVLLVVKKC